MKSFPQKIFITGTDTGIGKTVVSAILVRGLKANYWKPIQSGLEEPDTDWIKHHTQLPDRYFLPERFRLTQPLSPHLAAEIDEVQISLNDFDIPEYQAQNLIIEGAGGIMVPINQEHYIVDLISRLNIPVILVARSSLGTINHTLLTLEKLKSEEIQVIGVVLNGEKNPENKRAIESFGNVKVIAEIGKVDSFNPVSLRDLYEQEFDL
ncbi:MAG: dethiobiotin synthase [Balneolales bacterium]